MVVNLVQPKPQVEGLHFGSMLQNYYYHQNQNKTKKIDSRANKGLSYECLVRHFHIAHSKTEIQKQVT